MNAARGIGPDSQVIIYIFSMISCLLLPELLIEKIGSKKTFVIALIASLPYMASNLHLSWATMIPTAALYGLASGPASSAQTTYISEMATRYSSSAGGSLQNVMSTFFGFFTFFGESAQVLGNVISFYTLSLGNHTPPPDDFFLRSECGIHFDLDEFKNQTNTNLEPPSDTDRFILIGVFLLMGVIALLVPVLFADNLENDVKKSNGFQAVSRRFFATVRMLKHPQMVLLIPLSIYSGMEVVFYSNEYTQAYIACSWGIQHVGFVTICYGVCGALTGILVGPLVKCVSQMSVLFLAACINFISCILLYVWQPTPEVTIIYFAFAGVWGIADAIWYSQVSALYGLMFPNDREAAFSNYFFWSFFGFFISYCYANHFSIVVKINILLSVLVIGMTGYVVGQIKMRRSVKRTYRILDDMKTNEL